MIDVNVNDNRYSQNSDTFLFHDFENDFFVECNIYSVIIAPDRNYFLSIMIKRTLSRKYKYLFN